MSAHILKAQQDQPRYYPKWAVVDYQGDHFPEGKCVSLNTRQLFWYYFALKQYTPQLVWVGALNSVHNN